MSRVPAENNNMSNRTAELPPLKGLPRLLRELRYDEFSRQGAGIALVFVYGWFGQPQPLFYWIGLPIALAGVAVRMYASGCIIKNRELATAGPYALVRHPLYTGNILVLVGLCLASGLWWSWLVGAVFLWLYYPTAIEYEDRKLHGLFGTEWEAWSGRVPALVPRALPLKSLAAGDWSFAKSLRQNAEPLVVAWVLFWLYWLWRQLPQ